MTQWSLYVDESGSFRGGGGSLVAALLVPAPARVLNSPTLRRRMEEIWGPAPFPPHASVYLDPIGQLLLAAIQADDALRPPGRYATARWKASRRLLGQLDDTPFAARLDELRNGRRVWLSRDDLKVTKSYLRHLPDVRADLERLDDVAALQRAAMDALLRRALAQTPGSRVVLSRAHAHSDGTLIPGTRLFRDCYLDALEVVLARVHRILGPGDTCELHVLTRDVQVDGVAAVPTTLSFGALLLKELIEVVRAQTGSAATCRASGGAVHYREHREMGQSVHPFLVFADWVATTCRPATRDAVTPLSELERHLESQRLPAGSLRASVLTPALGTLPLAGAAGPAEARICAALAGGAPLPEPPADPRWVVDQCSEWVGAAGGGVE